MARGKLGLVVGVAVLCSGMPVWAADPGVEAEIEVLKARLARLEKQVAQSETFTGEAAGLGEKAGLPTLQMPSGLRGITLSGYADISYLYNFNEQNNFGNSGRVFDTEGNGFTPNAFELVVEKPTTDETPIGFRADLFYGDDASVFKATGLGATGEDFDLQQAYVTARCPIGGGIDFKIGKFVTLLGAEVIESPANWNFSRSYMFGYSIPFTHTGILASYAWSDWLSTTGGVVNGWDIVDDNNKAKSLLGNVTLGPWNNLTLSSNMIYGAEQANNNRDQRGVISNILSWAPNDQLAFMVNWDYGHEEDAIGVTSAGGSGKDNASWQGYAFYARYTPNTWYALSSRVEWFNDQDNVRVAPGGGAVLAGSGHGDVKFFEWTLTNDFKLSEHVLARLEYRLDKADANVFRFDQGAADNLNTVAAELIYHF